MPVGCARAGSARAAASTHVGVGHDVVVVPEDGRQQAYEPSAVQHPVAHPRLRARARVNGPDRSSGGTGCMGPTRPRSGRGRTRARARLGTAATRRVLGTESGAAPWTGHQRWLVHRSLEPNGGGPTAARPLNVSAVADPPSAGDERWRSHRCPPTQPSGAHRVEAAVDVDDLAGGGREEVAHQRAHGPRGGRVVGLVPAERGAVAPQRLEVLEAGDRLGGQRLERPGARPGCSGCRRDRGRGRGSARSTRGRPSPRPSSRTPATPGSRRRSCRPPIRRTPSAGGRRPPAP